MQDHYCWSQGMWYDEREDLTNDDPVVDDPRLDDFNADDKIVQFEDYIKDMNDNYRGNHMMVPMGCDFTHANARQAFENMDRFINYFNSHTDENIVLQYSTPGEYLDALHAQEITWPVKYDDMFPYADNPQDFWTGYFASRMSAKKQVRDAQANLHASGEILSKAVLD